MKSLKTVLLVNAVSSGATGLWLILFARSAARLFDVPVPAAFTGVGAFLLVFAGLVYAESRRSPLQFERIRFIIALDRLWVMASLVLVLWPAAGLSGVGRLLVVAVAIWVALMAYLQASGLRKITA